MDKASSLMMQLKQIVMTSPIHFNVNYDINPWMMGNSNNIDRNLAVQQWNNLRNALISAGADIFVISAPPKNCPDAVFSANAGIALNEYFLPSLFKFEERQVEEPYFINWFLERGYNIPLSYSNLPRNEFSFEGAGDALLDKNLNVLWYGYGFRSSLNFKPQLEEFYNQFNITVHALKLVDSRWYHIDTAFCPLDNGMLLWYPDAFDMESRYMIKGAYGEKAISVSTEDALGFACNAVSVGDTLITPIISDKLKQKLENKNIKNIQVDLSEFKKSGGSAKCLTLELLNLK